jgi:hypothetical protein
MLIAAPHIEGVLCSGGIPPQINLVTRLRKAVSLNVPTAVIIGEAHMVPAGKEDGGNGTFLPSVCCAQMQCVM